MWFLDNNWDNKDVVSVVNFLKCVVTKVVLFLFVILKTDISQGSVVTHFGCGKIYSDCFIANCLLILTVKKIWKSVGIWWSYEAYKNGVVFWPTLYSASNIWQNGFKLKLRASFVKDLNAVPTFNQWLDLPIVRFANDFLIRPRTLIQKK